MGTHRTRARTKSLQLPDRPGWKMLLGELEAEIMELLWDRLENDWVSGREVLASLPPGRRTAYTTVTTVLTHLTRKGLLRVDKSGPSHRFKVAMSREEFTAERINEIVDRLMCDFPEETAARFIRAAEAAPAPLREHLSRLIAEHLSRED